MTQLDKVGCYPFMADMFHCDCQKNLFLGHLGNRLLNAADFHANERGFGIAYLNSVNRSWVLSRLAIELEEMPKAYAHFHVYTWIESAMRYFTNRNFKMVDIDSGKVYGYGRSIWAMIDTQTRQPANILEMQGGVLADYVVKDMECPIDKGSRVRMDDKAERFGQSVASYSDIDPNGHVNSVKYIEHVLDLFPVEWHTSHQLRRFEIAYVAEGHAGDALRFYRQVNGDGDFSIRVTGQGTADDGERELCRCRIIFVKS